MFDSKKLIFGFFCLFVCFLNDTICNITQEPQDLKKFNCAIGESAVIYHQ